ncbi:Inner membrane protein ybjJ [Bacteroidales bacterium Barb7]|nr:Inner membrane protein ybjJ [Bacteroidales bacterium Barb7]
MGLCFSSWASRIPDIKNFLHLDDASWGTVLLMIPLGQIVGMTLSGTLISKIGSKRVLLISIIGYAISLISIGMVRSEYMLLVALVVFGFFANFCNIAVNTQGVLLENYYKRPIMASFHGGWGLAGLLGGIMGLLMTALKIHPFFHFITIATFITIGIIANYKYLQPDKNPAKLETEGRNRPELFLFLLGILGFFGMAAEGAMMDWCGVYLQNVVGIKDYLAPLGLTAYMVTMALGRFVMDKATLKWGCRGVLQVCGLLIFAGLFIAVAYPNLIVTLIAFMIIGFGTCGIVPTVYSMVGQKTKISTGTALTIVSSISFLGFLLGPPLIGYISTATNLRYAYALIGLFGLCIVGLSARLKVLKS